MEDEVAAAKIQCRLREIQRRRQERDEARELARVKRAATARYGTVKYTDKSNPSAGERMTLSAPPGDWSSAKAYYGEMNNRERVPGAQARTRHDGPGASGAQAPRTPSIVLE